LRYRGRFNTLVGCGAGRTSRPGAGSNIATDFVVRAPADGYTLLAVVSSNLINATLYDAKPTLKGGC
jgi:hypothetical protein